MKKECCKEISKHMLTYRSLRLSAALWLVISVTFVTGVFADASKDLLDAARNGDLARVTELLEQGVDVEPRWPAANAPH